jgi:hypothetical protein
MTIRFDVDIDQERIHFEGEWLGKRELAEKIKRMIDNQDFRVGAVGFALEYLQKAVSNARPFSVTLAPEDADRLETFSKAAGLQPAIFIRQAIQAFLAAQPPVGQPSDPGSLDHDHVDITVEHSPTHTTITTEPIKPGEEKAAVPLTERKVQETSSPAVIIDPSLQIPDPSGPLPFEDSWFKKR